MNGESTKETMQSRHPKFLLQAFSPQFCQIKFVLIQLGTLWPRKGSQVHLELKTAAVTVAGWRCALVGDFRKQQPTLTTASCGSSLYRTYTNIHTQTQTKAAAFDQSASEYQKKKFSPSEFSSSLTKRHFFWGGYTVGIQISLAPFSPSLCFSGKSL